jgi:hypothetical protein
VVAAQQFQEDAPLDDALVLDLLFYTIFTHGKVPPFRVTAPGQLVLSPGHSIIRLTEIKWSYSDDPRQVQPLTP